MTSPIVAETYVPNEGDPEAPIVALGEAPGTNEREQKRPFVGEAGTKLRGTLLRNGIQDSSVYFANLAHVQPAGNDFDKLVDTIWLESGLNELRNYFVSRKTKPLVVVPLGNNPLNYLCGPLPKPKISNWRGSIIRSSWKGLEDVKIIPTYHPSAVVRDASLYPIFDIDIRRIFHDSQFPEFNLPKVTDVIVKNNPLLLEEITEKLLTYPLLAVDIENYRKIKRLACIGFSPSPDIGYCIVWDDSAHTRKCLDRLLSSDVPKVFQYGTHDVNYLRLHGFIVNGYHWDTYIASHVMTPELPHTLAFQVSIFTREPFYKYHGEEGDEKSWSDAEIGKDDFWKYNNKDTTRTIEIALVQKEQIASVPQWQRVFDFEMEFLQVCHDMMQNGMRIDEVRLKLLRDTAINRLAENSKMLNGLTDNILLVTRKKKQKSVSTRNQTIYVLHELLELPKRTNREGGITVDEDALVSLLNLCINKVEEYKTKEKKREWMLKQAVITLMLRIRSDEKLLSTYLNITYSADGRVRSTYKFGPETGRLASSQFVDGTGLNAQTFPRGDI